LRKSFASNLDDLEKSFQEEAITELRTTLEVLPAKQSKDLILEMLRDDDAEAAMSDLLNVVRSMSLERTKKIFSEFKTEEESKILHQILVEMGDLAERPTAVPNRS
jgi:hypothetical protein